MKKKIKLFWKESCPRCPEAKLLLAERGNVETYDVDKVDGLAEAAFHAVLATPSIVIVDERGQEVCAWRGEVPSAGQLAEML